jgi:hypothetical protein
MRAGSRGPRSRCRRLLDAFALEGLWGAGLEAPPAEARCLSLPKPDDPRPVPTR